MKLFSSKKGEIITLIVVIAIIVMVFVSFIYVLGGRECRTNRDCGKESYCGSDFSCHQIPVIERTVNNGNTLTMPALIFGICMIITALIFRWDKIKPRRMQYRGSVMQPQDNNEQEILKSP